MTTASLPEKWGDENIWLRTLFVKSNLIWLFRDEIPKLLVNELHWLDAILRDAYLVAGAAARHSSSDEDAFDRSINLVKSYIEQCISRMGSDPELERLRATADRATACNPLKDIFEYLDKQAALIYGPAFARKTTLQPTWMNDHPLRSARVGEYPDPYHFTAQTEISGNNAAIQLPIHLDGFEVTSLLAIPALLTHELICHAHAREDGNDSRSIWAEGVMDWAAIHFFEQWAWRLDLPYGNTEEHGRLLWARRANSSRVTGRNAAYTFAQWLANERSVREIDVSRTVVAKFAIEVNSWQAPLIKKDYLATRLANIYHDEELQECIRSWRNDGGPVSDLLG